MKVYALNLFNAADKAEYLAYSKRSVREVQAHGGRAVALGRFREAAAGEIKPLFDGLDDLRPIFK